MDRGSRLLLKVLARQEDLKGFQSVLDLGCGVGVLGICLAAQDPRRRVLMIDRDALALAVSRHNWRLNRLPEDRVDFRGALGLPGKEEERFDLIVSNLPAKAGPPVLERLCREAASLLSARGVFATVVVRPLMEKVEAWLRSSGLQVILQERTANHAVFVASPSKPMADGPAAAPAATPLLDPYLRGRFPFEAWGRRYSLRSAYNLPDFDTLGYGTYLGLGLMRTLLRLCPRSGRFLFWNPGQGHFPVFALLESAQGADAEYASDLTLASRDLLQLRVSAAQLEEMGFKLPEDRLIHRANLWDLPERMGDGSCRAIVAVPDPDPEVPWPEWITAEAWKLLVDRGLLLVVSRSSYAHRMSIAGASYRLYDEKKSRGFRAMLMRKEA